MDQLTLRDIDDELSARICSLADRQGISPDEMVLRLVRKGVGLTEEPGNSQTIGDSLDHLFGTMSPEESAELQEALEYFHTVDESMWR